MLEESRTLWEILGYSWENEQCRKYRLRHYTEKAQHPGYTAPVRDTECGRDEASLAPET